MELRGTLEDKVDTLPSPPPVLRRIGAVLANPDASAGDIVDALRLDPVVSGKILRLANSAYLGIPRTVSSLQNAVVLLGIRRVHSLVLGSAALSLPPRGAALPFDMVDYWKHSVTTAIVCESVARHLKRYDPIDPGETFCAGMLHDIGKLVLGVCDPATVRETAETAVRSHRPYHIVEHRETSHTAAGELLAERWNYPADLAAAIAWHHAPAEAGAFTRIAAIVHVCDIVVHVIGFQTVPGECVPEIDSGALAQVGLDPERLRVIARDALEDESRLESMMEFVG